jgi:hypothetical protein
MQPQSQGRRNCFHTYAKEGMVMNIRFWVFALTQVAFSVIANEYNNGRGASWCVTVLL